MLTIDQCKNIDPSVSELSDEEIQSILSSQYELGRLIFDDWFDNKLGSKHPVGVLQEPKGSNTLQACQQKSEKQQ